MIDVKVTVLDHGYVSLVESWGSDERIVEAARMSTGKGFLGWGSRCDQCGYEYPEESWVRVGDARHCPNDHPCKLIAGDTKLLRFLYENRHATPFEMAGMTIEVQAPIFVFREWHRHRVPFSYNEASARYAPLPALDYVPSVERLMLGSDGKNKQAGTITGATALTEEVAEKFRASLEEHYKRGEEIYQNALFAGVPKELARCAMSVGRHSKMRASANLRGWLNFVALRSDANPGAQWEIRRYGNAVREIAKTLFPRTVALFDELGRAP